MEEKKVPLAGFWSISPVNASVLVRRNFSGPTSRFLRRQMD
jgi:hypothetical protein